MWETVLPGVLGAVVMMFVGRILINRLDSWLGRYGTSSVQVLTAPVTEVLVGTWAVCWFLSEAAHDIRADYAIWQIVFSLVIVLLGVVLIIHGLRRRRRTREAVITDAEPPGRA